ncbi:MAG: TrkH family potassium uptake protein [Paludibacteraceae bacterium]|nr:TrkH family potassium uptake protein [Paludibacteraceae bacterium]
MTRTFNWRLVIKTLGALLLIESFFMAVPTLLALFRHDYDFSAFLISTCITFVCGLIGVLRGFRADERVSEREGYVIVALVWVVFSIFGLLPYYLSGSIDSFTDSFFETMSGFTTTGATIVTDVEQLSHATLLWRSLTQWLGGMGIIVLSIAILPMFGLGGMQLYAAEVTGLTYEKVSPKIADTAKLLWGIYVVLTATESVLLRLFGMNWFDAVNHALTTIATGGFSTYNSSVALFSPAIQYTIAVFMILSGINFALFIYVLIGKPQRLFQDEETKWYMSLLGVATLLVSTGYFFTHYNYSLGGAEEAFRKGLFTVAASVTSTGFAVDNYMTWYPLLWVVVFILMFSGACAGSTSGGIKIVRIIIFAKNGFAEFQRRIHPNAVIPVKLNGKPLSQQTIGNVMAFMVFYVVIVIVTVLIFCACGIDFDEAIGTTISAIGNVGISIGHYGPADTYAAFPTIAKWVMTFVMLVGRLEIFTVLLLFTRALWRK